jgi:hypothetical protein
MRTRILTLAAAVVIGSAAMMDAAQAGVAGPAASMQSTAQSLSITEQVRRVCRTVFRCGKFPRGCWWDKQCTVTGDYPPEHGRR